MTGAVQVLPLPPVANANQAQTTGTDKHLSSQGSSFTSALDDADRKLGTQPANERAAAKSAARKEAKEASAKDGKDASPNTAAAQHADTTPQPQPQDPKPTPHAAGTPQPTTAAAAKTGEEAVPTDALAALAGAAAGAVASSAAPGTGAAAAKTAAALTNTAERAAAPVVSAATAATAASRAADARDADADAADQADDDTGQAPDDTATAAADDPASLALTLPASLAALPSANTPGTSSTTASATNSASGPDGTTQAAASQPLLPGLATTASGAATAADANPQAIPAAYQSSTPVQPSTQLAVAILRGVGTDSSQSFNLQLKPAKLGTVEVKLDIDDKGRASATILADKPETLQMLQQDQHQLVRALNEAGVSTDAGNLNFSLRDTSNGGAFSESGQRGNGSGRNGSGASAGIETEEAAAPPTRAVDRLYDIRA